MEYGCIGEKLTHSFSKEIHSLLFDYDYTIKEIPKNKLDIFMSEKNFKGINVTIPYKQDVIPYLYRISDTAKKIGAVNTIINRNGKLYGYNTDFSGMSMLLKKNKIELYGKTVLILGSGGTSKTAAAVAESMGAGSILRVSRTAKEGCITYDEAYRKYSDAQVIINTTPCGMYPNIIGEPIDLCRFNRAESVADAIYNPLCSNLVVKAKQMGLNATGGLYMLIAQAAAAAELFTGVKVSTEKIDFVYKEILKQKRNIVLIGMPSCGKSTVGKMLAKELSMQFIDTDVQIEKYTHKKIEDIFKEQGEEEFRKIESKIIAEVSAKQNCVIATGGGAVLNGLNVTLLRGNGKIYFLDRSTNLLCATSDRPLSSNRHDLEKRYKERYNIYCDAADKTVINNTAASVAVTRIKEYFAL